MDVELLIEGEEEMFVFVTKSGMVLLAIVAFIIGIFLFCGGYSLISDMVENYHVGKVNGNLGSVFQISDIKYEKSIASLRSEFKKRYKNIDAELKLKDKYPDNEKLRQKIKNHQSYLQSMEKTIISCPQHENIIYKKCSKCNGKGKRFILFKCRHCKGDGERKKKRLCPNCKSWNAQIKGADLLK